MAPLIARQNKMKLVPFVLSYPAVKLSERKSVLSRCFVLMQEQGLAPSPTKIVEQIASNRASGLVARLQHAHDARTNVTSSDPTDSG